MGCTKCYVVALEELGTKFYLKREEVRMNAKTRLDVPVGVFDPDLTEAIKYTDYEEAKRVAAKYGSSGTHVETIKTGEKLKGNIIMGKNYNQSKKAKEEFLKTSLIALLMCEEPQKIFTKEELCELLGKPDREIRRDIAELANYVAVVSLSNSKGYRVLQCKDDDSPELLMEYRDLIDHQLNDFKSRIDNIRARMKPLVALKCVIEKTLAKYVDQVLHSAYIKTSDE